MRLPPMTSRDRRALLLLALCAVVFTAVYFWPEGGAAAVVGPATSVEQMERRIRRMRRLAASAPAREETLKRAMEELRRREEGMIRAETPSQAQAQMLEIVRRVAKNQPESFQLRGTEFAPPRALGDAYGEVVMTVTVESPIEQLVTFLTDLANQPELISVGEIQISQASGKGKLIPARLTLTAVAPRALAPQKKGGAAF